MSGNRAGELVFLAMLLILPIAALIARRPPLGRTMLLIIAWIGIFAVGLLVASQRDRLSVLWRNQSVEGRETRILMAADGHFWADVDLDGVTRRMLIDSGATTTAISEATALEAKLKDDSPFPVVLNTANGQITARTATASRIVIGSIIARDVPVVVSPAFGNTDVVGMNVLSRLRAWRVEGRTLVLTP